MPIMDGVTLVRSLAKTGVSIPAVIFVSGFGDIDLKEMYSLGAEAFLSKPLRREELIEVLERSVAERSTLWTEAMPKAPRQSLEMKAQSIEEGREAAFCLGRGGFSVRSPNPLSLGKVKFRITFDLEPGEIAGEGHVRWYSRANATAGVEFTYLDAKCRSWVAEKITVTKPRAFIPDCC